MVLFNAEFFLPFLTKVVREDASRPFWRYVCALMHAHFAWPGLPSYKMSTLATYGRLPNPSSHRPVDMCTNIAVLIQAAVPRLKYSLKWAEWPDYRPAAEYWKAKKETDKVLAVTKALEATDLETAIRNYKEALDATYLYSKQYDDVTHANLFAKLNGFQEYQGREILDRLTVCLSRAGRDREIVEVIDRYFAVFPTARMEAVRKRRDRAAKKLEMTSPAISG